MGINKIDSRGVYTLVAPEAALGVFPVAATWRKLDLNSYNDAKSVYDSSTREVMDGSRQPRKGKRSKKDVTFGYNIDVTKSNTLAQVASFLYNAPKEKFTTRSAVAGTILTSVVTNPLVSMTATTITATTTLAALVANDIFILEDGLNDRTPLVVTSVAAAVVTFSVLNAGQTVKVNTALSNARIVKVGVRGAAGDLRLSANATTATLTATTLNFTTLGLTKGEWIFVGADLPANKFPTVAPFYARIRDITAGVLTFDTTTSPLLTDTGIGIQICVFFGTFITNGDIRTSYTHARHLGTDDNGKKLVETFTGCVPNEMSINAPEADYVRLDLAYVGTNHSPTRLDTSVFNTTYATVKEPPDEDAFHTASDLFRQRLAVVGDAINPAALTSFVQEATLSITNNINADTGNGKLGAFDFSVGQFGLSGSLTAYFIGFDALDAVKCDCTVGMDLILAAKNAGTVIDMPSFGLGGSVEAELNTSIKIPLEQAAFRSSIYGFMLGWTSFSYLPASAMPEGTDASCTC